MNKYLIILLLVLTGTIAHAKKEHYYYNALQRRTYDKDSAKSYIEFTKTDKCYEIKQYSMSDVLLMEGPFANIPDDLRYNREGVYTYYHTNGNLSSKGGYAHGMRNGEWKTYASINGHLTGESHYTNDSLDGPYIKYHFLTGKKIYEGNYVNGRQDGLWKYFSNGRLTDEETYANDKSIKRKTYDSTGAGYKILLYNSDKKLITAKRYDGTGKEIAIQVSHNDSVNAIYNYVEQMPYPKFNTSHFLSKNLVYPKSAITNNIEGRVIVKFVVNEEGDVQDVTIVNSVDPDIDAEALRVVSKMPKWSPGMQNGDVVKVYYTLPLSFKLK